MASRLRIFFPLLGKLCKEMSVYIEKPQRKAWNMKPMHYGSWIMYSVHQSGRKDNINKATHATSLHKAPTSGPWESVFRTGPIDCITSSLVPDKHWTWSFGRSGLILLSSLLLLNTSWHICWGKVMSSDMFYSFISPRSTFPVIAGFLKFLSAMVSPEPT